MSTCPFPPHKVSSNKVAFGLFWQSFQQGVCHERPSDCELLRRALKIVWLKILSRCLARILEGVLRGRSQKVAVEGT